MTHLDELEGIGPILASRLAVYLGSGDAHAALTKLQRDPYLAMTVPGLSFKRADRLALGSLGVEKSSAIRQRHVNRFILKRRGPLPRDAYLFERRRLGIEGARFATFGAEVEGDVFWLPEQLEAERALALWVEQSMSRPPLPGLDREPVNDACDRFKVNEEQRKALEVALKATLSLLTGEAGSGKTLTVAAIVDANVRWNRPVSVVTFSGKASQRVKDVLQEHGVGNEAALRPTVSTIHAALGAVEGGDFTVDRLPFLHVIVDEAGQVSTYLLAKLVARLSPHARLTLVGDPNQLAPTGHGAPFSDLLNLPVPHVHLEKNYRQADQEEIYKLSKAILSGVPYAPRQGAQLLLGCSVPKRLMALVAELAPKNLAPSHWQVITATNRTRVWANLLIQSHLNATGEPLVTTRDVGHKVTIRRGDKVMLLCNDRALGITNGQQGVALAADRAGLEIESRGGRVTIPQEFVADYIALAYAATCHKCQGSEYQSVIALEKMAVAYQPKRWHYTSATRAKTQLAFVSTLDPEAWWSNATEEEQKRESSLAKRLTTANFIQTLV